MKFVALFFTLVMLGCSSALAQPADRQPSISLLEDAWDADALGAAPAGPVRDLIPIALNLIKTFEGWFPTAYDDPIGYCTIGYGHLIVTRSDIVRQKTRCADLGSLGEFAGELTEEQGADLLLADTISARRAVQAGISPEIQLSDEQFGALTSFVFNVGKSNFEKSTMRKLINAGDMEGAAAQFMRWVRAGGEVFNGLLFRRSCEKALFEGTLVYGPDNVFNRELCETLGVAPEAGSTLDIYGDSSP